MVAHLPVFENKLVIIIAIIIIIVTLFDTDADLRTSREHPDLLIRQENSEAIFPTWSAPAAAVHAEEPVYVEQFARGRREGAYIRHGAIGVTDHLTDVVAPSDAGVSSKPSPRLRRATERIERAISSE